MQRNAESLAVLEAVAGVRVWPGWVTLTLDPDARRVHKSLSRRQGGCKAKSRWSTIPRSSRSALSRTSDVAERLDAVDEEVLYDVLELEARQREELAPFLPKKPFDKG